MRTVVGAVAIAMLAGCVAHNVAPDAVRTPAGAKPAAEKIEPALRAYWAKTLKDPDSVKQLQIFGEPVLRQWANMAGRVDEGWLVCVEYNAKNSYGAYVGLKPDRIIMRTTPEGSVYVVDGIPWAAVRSGCR